MLKYLRISVRFATFEQRKQHHGDLIDKRKDTLDANQGETHHAKYFDGPPPLHHELEDSDEQHAADGGECYF